MAAAIPGTGLLENVGGLLHVIAALSTPFLNGRRSTWGTTPEERASRYPGDELVANPKGGALRATTLEAPPDEVWPWLQQVGQRRGGFYSYQRLENMAGCGIRNVDRLVPDLPPLEVGGQVYLAKGMAPYEVVVCDPPRALVLHQLVDPGTQRALSSDEPRPPQWFQAVWAFHLLDHEGRTRLVTRAAVDHSGGIRNHLTTAFVGPVSHVMERAMFRNLRRLVSPRPGPPGPPAAAQFPSGARARRGLAAGTRGAVGGRGPDDDGVDGMAPPQSQRMPSESTSRPTTARALVVVWPRSSVG